MRYYDAKSVARLHPSAVERRAMRALLTWLSMHAMCAKRVGRGRRKRYQTVNLTDVQLVSHEAVVLDCADLAAIERLLGRRTGRPRIHERCVG